MILTDSRLFKASASYVLHTFLLLSTFSSNFSLDGTNAPTNEELVRLGFQDVNTALANTVEAIEIATSKGYNKVDFEKMVEKTIIQGTEEIRKEW